MSAETVFNIAFVVFLLLFSVAIFRVCRTPRQKAATARDVIAAARHDVGPDSLRLLEDLDAHLDTYADRIAGLYEPTASPDPVLAAGHDRMLAAVREDQQRGEGS